MTRPRFTLTVVTTADGYIARHKEDAPQLWASAEEQEIFFRDVEAADWSVMGRHTHEAADRPDRRRIVFSSQGGGWKRPTQLWLDPAGLTPTDLAQQVAHIHPLENGLILGGTAVHDWFLDHDAIDEIHLTIEPLTFGSGLPVLTGQGGRDPRETFSEAGFTLTEDLPLNTTGTRYTVWTRAR
ncbi:MAG: dihydrofolate reductase family protein [Rhodobacteraceae bacterium]|nr:dihydrofolate reductase family protein [Paracoccaceae bacterium]